MATLTIRDVSDETLESLKTQASRNRRSLNGEMLYIIDFAVSKHDEIDMEAIRRERIRKQREALDACFGAWKSDPRSTAEIIADIEGARTPGREVNL